MSFKLATATLSALIVLSGTAFAQKVNLENGVAIKGYDPVAYFTDHKPIKGVPEYRADYEGATYEFTSVAHRILFVEAPEKYVPQFGGFCAYGTALGHKADVDPTAFTIVDGKLYLNYNAKVMTSWRQDIPGYIVKATKAWPNVSQQTAVAH